MRQDSISLCFSSFVIYPLLKDQLGWFLVNSRWPGEHNKNSPTKSYVLGVTWYWFPLLLLLMILNLRSQSVITSFAPMQSMHNELKNRKMGSSFSILHFVSILNTGAPPATKCSLYQIYVLKYLAFTICQLSKCFTSNVYLLQSKIPT